MHVLVAHIQQQEQQLLVYHVHPCQVLQVVHRLVGQPGVMQVMVYPLVLVIYVTLVNILMVVAHVLHAYLLELLLVTQVLDKLRHVMQVMV